MHECLVDIARKKQLPDQNLIAMKLGIELKMLTSFPRRMGALAAREQLLVAWNNVSYIADPVSGWKYHLAFYHPDYGCIACRWNEKVGFPNNVLPVSGNVIWITTSQGKIIRISIDNIGCKVNAVVSKDSGWHKLLYADRDNLWTTKWENNQIAQLRFTKNSFSIVHKKPYNGTLRSMYPLEDGMWVLEEGEGSFIFSKLLSVWSKNLDAVVHAEEKKTYLFHEPFFVCTEEEYFYYTIDPRRGWRKMPLWRESERDFTSLFARIGNVYYVAVHRGNSLKIELYRFKEESDGKAEHVWDILHYPHPRLLSYDGLICIAYIGPIEVYARTDVPENDGFLIWNPRSDIFYTNLPQTSVAHAKHVLASKLQIPTAWLNSENKQQAQNAR